MIIKKCMFMFCAVAIMLMSIAPVASAATIDLSTAKQESILVDTVPEDAIILSETVDTLYFDPQTGEQVFKTSEEQPLSSDLYEVTVNTIICQDYGGIVELKIRLKAKSPLCLFKSIRGTWTVQTKDLEYNYSNAPIFDTLLTPYSSYSSQPYRCPHEFKIGETVNVYWNYHINLVKGSLLNGGQIAGSNVCKIVR